MEPITFTACALGCIFVPHVASKVFDTILMQMPWNRQKTENFYDFLAAIDSSETIGEMVRKTKEVGPLEWHDWFKGVRYQSPVWAKEVRTKEWMKKNRVKY